MTMQPDLLKLLRTLAGLTQAELADAIGMSTTYYGLMERGRNAMEPRTELAIIQAMDDIDRRRALVRPEYYSAQLRFQIRDLRIAQRHLHRGDDVSAMAGVALSALASPSGIIQNVSINSYPGYLNTLTDPPHEPEAYQECLVPIDYWREDGGSSDGVDSFYWWDQPVFIVNGEQVTRGEIIDYAADRERDLCNGYNYAAAVKTRDMFDLGEALPELMKRFAFEILYGEQIKMTGI
jgi:transcriptional regulator with XRE-family HTH domain